MQATLYPQTAGKLVSDAGQISMDLVIRIDYRINHIPTPGSGNKPAPIRSTVYRSQHCTGAELEFFSEAHNKKI